MSALYEKMVKPNNPENIFYDLNMETYKKYKAHNDTLVLYEGTDEEMIFVPIEVMDRFKCVITSREDFNTIGYDASSLTDEQMIDIALNVGESLVEENYWESLEYWAEELDLPKTIEEEDCDDEDYE